MPPIEPSSPSEAVAAFLDDLAKLIALAAILPLLVVTAMGGAEIARAWF